jgi:hypothetical protein
MDRWVYVGFKHPVTLTPNSLAKLALASDPSTSALAIQCTNGGHPQVHGLFDQQRAFQATLQYERYGGYQPPGLFQVQLLGPGHLKVMRDWIVLGELNDGALAPRTQDALGDGPVVEFFTKSIKKTLGDSFGRGEAAEGKANRRSTRHGVARVDPNSSPYSGASASSRSWRIIFVR